MIERIAVHPGRYHDSAFLMRLGRVLEAPDAVQEAVLLMATEMNRDLLRQAGFPAAVLSDAGPMDLVIALRADDEEAADRAMARAEELLSGGGGPAADPADRRSATVDDALQETGSDPSATVVSISVPGPYAAHVAHRALDAGCHVFLFSDNVPLAAEIELKARGAEQGLLVMGPDCGTSILAGVRLGFANRVSPGPVGLVGPSGTGIQEISCGLAARGIGISHAIGTGGRDMSAEVGGVMTAMGAELLADDPGTEVIVLVAKSPAPAAAARLHELLANCGKPAVVRYLGQPPGESADGVIYAASLDEAVASAAAHVLGEGAPAPDPGEPDTAPPEFTGVGGRLIGLFGGGSLAAEARELLRRAGIHERGIGEPWLPGDALPDGGHLLLDTGDDVYTRGRPHPMVDQAARSELLGEAVRHPGVGVVLLDLVLGDGAHPDPAPELVAAVRTAKEDRGDGQPIVICSVSGTDDDPQDAARQERTLRDGGIVVRRSAAEAATFAALMLAGAGEGSET